MADTMTLGGLETSACPICRSDRTRTIYPSRRKSQTIGEHEFRPSGDTPLEDPLVRCLDCGMEYVNPRVPMDLVLEGYATAVDETFVSQVAGRELTFRRGLNTLQKIWRKPPGRLLDIGTANGSFLKVAKAAGWTVSGCEPNRWLCAWCEVTYGITLTPGTVFDGRYEAGSFDMITLWDVLEHTADPLGVLRECERLLAPGGLIVINVPDRGSWIARLMGQRWVFLISVHNYYFNRKTIRLIANKAGLSTIRMQPHFQSLELDYILFRAEPLAGPLARWARKIAKALRIGGMQVPYWIGQTLVVATRTEAS